MTRTRKDAHEDHSNVPEVGDAFPIPGPVQETRSDIGFDVIVANLQQLANAIGAMYGRIDVLGSHIEKTERMVFSLEAVLNPMPTASEPTEHAKVQRRRSLDDMQFALKRLMQPEPRPADDDSPQVLHDAINETIALRRLVMDLMQASMNMHQHGLTAVRDMTAR